MSEFDAQDCIKEFNKYEKGLFCVDSFIRGARWQHAKLSEQLRDYEAALKYTGHECMNNETCPPRDKMQMMARTTFAKWKQPKNQT